MLYDVFGFALIFLFTVALAVPLGAYLKRVYRNESSFLDFVKPIEHWVFKVCRIDPGASMNWKEYLLAMLTIQLIWIVPAFILLMIQCAGTLQTDSATFGAFLFVLILILSVLSLFVILMSGPVTEHFSLR